MAQEKKESFVVEAEDNNPGQQHIVYFTDGVNPPRFIPIEIDEEIND